MIFGDVNPSGKLPVTFPRTVGQVPIYYNSKNTGRPPGAAKYTSKYLDLPMTPLFPFGYGLSYTKFEYDDLHVNTRRGDGMTVITVSVEVRNTGDRTGEEVVQLYVQDVVGSSTRPVKELKGFERIILEPDEKQEVEFKLTSDDLKYYNEDLEYVVEPGLFRVWVGPNSAEGREGQFELP